MVIRGCTLSDNFDIYENSANLVFNVSHIFLARTFVMLHIFCNTVEPSVGWKLMGTQWLFSVIYPFKEANIIFQNFVHVKDGKTFLDDFSIHA